jgi:flagellar L-ring protein precursor FlgH
MKKTVMLLVRVAPIAGMAFVLGGCAALERLTQIGEQPKLSAIENPTAAPGYKPVQIPIHYGEMARAPSSRTSARTRSAIS